MGLGGFLKDVIGGGAKGFLAGGPWGAVAGAGLSAASNLLKNKSANEAEKAERAIYNEWLKDRSKSVDEIAAKLAANGVDIYGPQVRTTSSQGESYMRTVMNQTQQQVKTTRAEDKPMESAVRGLLMGELGKPQQVTEGEIAATLAGFGKAGREGATAEQNIASRFGGTNVGAAAGSPAANAAALEAVKYRAGIPQEELRRRMAIAGQSQGFLDPRMGQTTKTRGVTTSQGNTSNTSTQTGPPDLANILALHQFGSPGPPQSMNTGYSPTGAALGVGSDLLNNLSMIYGAGAGQGQGPGAASPTQANPFFQSPLIPGSQITAPKLW